MTVRRAATVALALLVTLGARTASAQEVTLQIGSTAPANSPWDIGLRKIAAEWSRVSGGRVRMTFPRSVANASQEDLIQKLKFSLDGAVLETTGLGFIDPDVFFLSLPSIIRDDAEYERAMAAAMPLIKAKMAGRYEIVATAKGGWIRFFSNQPIRTPEDLRNIRMGVNRNMDSLTKLLQSVGARTVKTDTAATLLQFNSGAMDAMYSSPLYVAALWSQFRRSITHMTGFKVAPFFGAVIINKRSWDRVPDSLKPLLLDAAERVCVEISAETAALEERGIEAMRRGGLTVPDYTAADERAWNALYAEKIPEVALEWYSPEFTAAILAAIGR
ncbi:MAG: hypothetical protein CVV47_00375 [Spirochaetae bacterium HGW-Spirochaetae-3]|jgi:TRAP-type C4-dicarboxylate transport system substrate-binding protein|nr:MAG: hypothetical protein CVV47_00375 [Spirochaetae bacterium HGW-Spirochaetae-3]